MYKRQPLYYDDISYDSQETYTYGGRVYENKALDLEGENAQFTQVELQLGVADAVITQDGGPGYVNAENFPEGKISFQVADGRLIVRDLTQKANLNFNLRRSKQLRARKLTVNLPPEVKLSAISLNRGAGDLSVTNVSADTITIADGVGNLYMENISVNSMNLSGGVGDCTLVNFTSTGEVEITRGVGEMELSRVNIGGNLTVSGGTGDFDLNGAVKGDIDVYKRQAERAFDELRTKCDRITAAHKELQETFCQFPKERHLQNIRESGYFRYAREVLFSSVESCDAKRFIGLAMSQGGLQTILKTVPEQIEGTLGDFVRRVEESFKNETISIRFSYRMRIGIK